MKHPTYHTPKVKVVDTVGAGDALYRGLRGFFATGEKHP